MSDEPRDPQLEDLFSLSIETALANARTMLPGKVVSYDSLKQRASVQPLIKEAHVAEDDTRTIEALPELQDVPVWHFGGNANARITVPVSAGDYGMIIFSSSSIARWKLTGGIVDPGDDRHHDLSDCVFVPGLHAQTPPTTAPTDAVVVHGNFKSGGPLGTEPTLMATTFLNNLNTLLAAIATNVGTSGTPAGATAAGGAITTAIATFNSFVAAFTTTMTEVK